MTDWESAQVEALRARVAELESQLEANTTALQSAQAAAMQVAQEAFDKEREANQKAWAALQAISLSDAPGFAQAMAKAALESRARV